MSNVKVKNEDATSKKIGKLNNDFYQKPFKVEYVHDKNGPKTKIIEKRYYGDNKNPVIKNRLVGLEKNGKVIFDLGVKK